MFTFRFVDLVLLFVVGAVLLVGLALLAIRRRNEVLQDFLTPDEPHIEQEFFKKRPAPTEPTEAASDESPSEVEAPDEVQWGSVEDKS